MQIPQTDPFDGHRSRLPDRRLDNGPIAIAAILDPLAVDARGARRAEPAFPGLLAAVVVDVLEVECVDVARQVAAQIGQSNTSSFYRCIRSSKTRSLVQKNIYLPELQLHE